MRDNVPKLVGGMAALVALAAGIFGHVESFYCVGRAAIAFVLGSVGYQAWYVFFVCHVPAQRVAIVAPQSAAPSGAAEQTP